MQNGTKRIILRLLIWVLLCCSSDVLCTIGVTCSDWQWWVIQFLLAGTCLCGAIGVKLR